MSEKIDLSSLIVASAKGSDQPERKQRGLKIRRETRARLLAQEYVRNGMNITEAYKTVTGLNPKNMVISKMTHGEDDAFVDELKKLVEAARIDQAAVLNNLWTLINSSIFDFFDEHGTMLTIAEIKKLPRIYQQLVEQVKVKTAEIVVKDQAGNVMVDDNGNPYLRHVQEVEIKMPPKLLGIELLAKIMKWIGPNIVINNNTTNIANVMQEKAQQRRLMESHYETIADGEVTVTQSDPRQS